MKENMNMKDTWMINALLAVILTLLGGYYYNSSVRNAYAGPGWDTNGVMAITVPDESERLVLVDTSKQNIMVYRTLGAGQFRLVGARSYQYDVELEDTSGSAYEKSVAYGTYLQVLSDYMKQKK